MIEPQHLTEQQDVIAAVIPRIGLAFEGDEMCVDQRRVAVAGTVFHRAKTVGRRVGESARDMALLLAQQVDREMIDHVEQVEVTAGARNRHQDQRRVERDRGKGIDSDAGRLALRIDAGDDGDAGGEKAERVAEFAGRKTHRGGIV